MTIRYNYNLLQEKAKNGAPLTGREVAHLAILTLEQAQKATASDMSVAGFYLKKAEVYARIAQAIRS